MARTNNKPKTTRAVLEVTPLMFPTGTVQTHRPNQASPYGIPWSNVARWEPWFSEFAAEWGVDPRLIASMSIVESDSNQYRTRAKTGTRDQVIKGGDNFDPHPSIGIMQIKPHFHQATLPDADVFTPDGNIRLGARLMRDFIEQLGSWQDAIRLKYHPGTSPDGTTEQDYVDTIESLLREFEQAVPCIPDQPPPFDGTKKTVNDVVFHPDQRTVTVTIDGLNSRKFANDEACLTRAPLALGERVDVLYWIRGEPFQNESRWWVTADGSRIWSGGTAESPSEDRTGRGGGMSLFESMRAAGMSISQAPFDSFSHSICDCYDFAIPVGTPLPALSGGEVIVAEATSDQYRPHKVIVRTGSLGDHLYGHLSELHVNVGDMVEAGTVLGLSGSENGPHLHLQLDRGASALGLNLTQILQREGFDLSAFPDVSEISMITPAAMLEAPMMMEAPVVIDKFLPTPKWNANRFDPETGVMGRPRFIAIHIQQGSSTNSWNFHAFQVNASATVFANRDGSIWRCVPEQHGPWTNGDVCRPTSDGQRVLTLGGDPNNWCLTIETEGFATPNDFGWPVGPTEPQFNSVLWQVRTWMERYDIPVENIIRHADLNSCTHAEYAQFVRPSCTPANGCWGGRDFCPGNSYFQRLIDALREDVIEEPEAPPPPAFTGEDVIITDRVFHAVPTDRQRVTAATDRVKCRKWANTSSPWVRAPLAMGEEFIAHYWVEGQNVGGERRWWVADDGARIWCGGTDRTPDDLL